MVRVHLIMTVSADGFITRDPSQDTTWDPAYDEAFFDPATRRIGILIMGANTFKLMPEPLADRKTIVMSSTPRESSDPSVEFFSGTPQELLSTLEDKGVREVALIGGAQINGSFLSENLVDELYLTVTPQLFGRGAALSDGYSLETKLRLREERKLSNDAILLHYEVVKQQ